MIFLKTLVTGNENIVESYEKETEGHKITTTVFNIIFSLKVDI